MTIHMMKKHETGFYKKKKDGSVVLNATPNRGRIYKDIDWYEYNPIKPLCQRAVQQAREIDSEIPDMDPTHLLSLLYLAKSGIAWHQDNGANDGTKTAPVVSFSLGNACDFKAKYDKKDEPISIHLESGDALLFGGPARMIWHAVTKVYKGSCPTSLSAFLGDARMNLTFREAPEAIGREEEFADFHKAIKIKRKREVS